MLSGIEAVSRLVHPRRCGPFPPRSRESRPREGLGIPRRPPPQSPSTCRAVRSAQVRCSLRTTSADRLQGTKLYVDKRGATLKGIAVDLGHPRRHDAGKRSCSLERGVIDAAERFCDVISRSEVQCWKARFPTIATSPGKSTCTRLRQPSKAASPTSMRLLGARKERTSPLKRNAFAPDPDDAVGQHGIDVLIRLVGGELRDYDLVCHGSPSPRAPGKKSPPMNRGDMRYLLDFGLNDGGNRLGMCFAAPASSASTITRTTGSVPLGRSSTRP